MTLQVRAAAKINLFLDILGRLDDGYHSLQMLMQSVSLYDTVSLHTTCSGDISLTCSHASLPTNNTNLAHRAAALFFSYANLQNPGLAIHVEKRIPLAAGLAGGSADAAAVLAGLNRLYDAPLTGAQLDEVALCIGSDVPFCLHGGTQLAQNRGEVLSPLPALQNCFVLLAKPEQSVSTQEAFAAFDRKDYIYRPHGVRLLDAAARGDFAKICSFAANVLEQVVEVPQRVEIKAIMREHGASLAQMSGSGPTIFGLFLTQEEALRCQTALQALPVETYLCTPVASAIRFD